VTRAELDMLLALIKVMPANDKVLIKVDEDIQKSSGGLFLASAEPVLKNTGTVLRLGDSEVFAGGVIEPGDRVLFTKGMGTRFDVPYTDVSPNGARFTAQYHLILVPFFDIEAKLED